MFTKGNTLNNARNDNLLFDHKNKRIELFLKVVIVAAVLAWLLKSCTPFSQGPNPLAGQPAPDFTLPTLSGQVKNMTEYRNGRSAIIFFWATWCPHCRKQIKELAQQRSDIEGKGIKIILVDIDESLQELCSGPADTV